MRKLLLLTTALSALSACDLSPDMTLPQLFGGSAYKEAQVVPAKVAGPAAPAVAAADDVKWKRVDEKAKIEEVAWWRMFNLPELDALEEQAMKDSPSLEVAAQRLNAARAMSDVADSSLFPSIEAGFGPQRQKSAAATINANMPPGTVVATKPFTTYTAQGSISYALDLFGKNRNTARAADREAEAEANNYRAARLLLQADLAQAYIERASLLAENDILERTVAARKQTRDHNKQKFDVGTVDDLTFANTENELANAEAERSIVAQQLAQSEHKIAVLVGVEPSTLGLSKTTLSAPPPVVPAGMPSRLLERRPDIQSAAHMIAAANARIGAARAGYFPDISLSAVGGYSAIKFSDLFKKPSQFWALGGANGAQILTQPIFEGGLLGGTLEARKAEYEGASANYRATALQAFREVEDNLSGLRNLREQADARATSLNASRRAYAVAGDRYKVGYSSQIDYLDAERGYLAAQRSNVQVLGQRYIATIQLVKALGGSWDSAPEATPVAPAAKAE